MFGVEQSFEQIRSPSAPNTSWFQIAACQLQSSKTWLSGGETSRRRVASLAS